MSMSDHRDPITDINDLDGYCHTVLCGINDLLDPIRPRDGEPFDIADSIPSVDQRESFEMMRRLLEHAESLAALLRYDVSTSHETCPEHDGIAIVTRRHIKKAVAAL